MTYDAQAAAIYNALDTLLLRMADLPKCPQYKAAEAAIGAAKQAIANGREALASESKSPVMALSAASSVPAVVVVKSKSPWKKSGIATPIIERPLA